MEKREAPSAPTKYAPINGYTKASIVERIQRDFKGKAMTALLSCTYLNGAGQKCAVGLFIPAKHPAAASTRPVREMLQDYQDLRKQMPLDVPGLMAFQRVHDCDLDREDTVAVQTARLVRWVEENVA